MFLHQKIYSVRIQNRFVHHHGTSEQFDTEIKNVGYLVVEMGEVDDLLTPKKQLPHPAIPPYFLGVNLDTHTYQNQLKSAFFWISI